MTPQQALQILNNASALALLSRADHEAVIRAVQTLDAIVNAPPAPHGEPEK